jgi:nucleoid DNA-binding protein
MDIDLLSKMVKELILDNDKVVLPGLGAFVAEIVPSTFSDKGYTINPPYRKLYFRAKPDEGNALALFYSKSNGVQLDVAERIISDFVAELRSVLFERKTVVFPGLGRLRATKENAVFFIADEDLDIYPDGFALEPVSMKTHVETQEEVRAAVAGLKAIVDEPEVIEVSVDESVMEIVSGTSAAEDNEQPLQELELEVLPEEFVKEQEEVVADTVTVAVDPEMPEVEPEVVVEEVAVVETQSDLQQAPAEQKEVANQEFRGPTFQELLQYEAIMRRRRRRGFLYTVLILIVLALVAFVVVARMYPTSFDNILYTPDELEIINWK